MKMKIVFALVLTIALVTVGYSRQDLKPEPAAAPDVTEQDKASLEISLAQMQLTAVKEYALKLQAENRVLTEKNKALTEKLAKLEKPPSK